MIASSNSFSRPASRGYKSESGSVSSQIYYDLRQRILSLELVPGTSLLRSELAKHYNVSLTPLRDALLSLESDGLVEIFPQSRTQVTFICEALIFEALFLRIALETEVIRHLCRQDVSEVVSTARNYISMQQTIMDQNDRIRMFQELDERFHRLLFNGAGRENLYDLLQTRSGNLDRVRRLQVHSAEKMNQIIQGHTAVINAIEAADEETAVREIRNHLRKPPNWVDEFRQQYSEYFG
ncbi:GntR family transcriptional regulator [uncultured Cohaesibacter sp.]|uniref:GntR family transcriptional regulator n=1 Tax=uncultured Cohaesibacter sp. TaxID=1002546 RepID=UPI00292FF6C2|nr:GntR family transcriptional regulator [uncultured Cohaesibacter sp.]